MAGLNSRFAEVTENDVLRMQDITIPNDTRKATKLGMKVLRDKQCFNTQFAHMSNWCLLSWSPSFADASLLEQQLSFHPPFQSSIQVNSTSIEQNISIPENLNAAISLENDCDFQHSNSKHLAWFPKETS